MEKITVIIPVYNVEDYLEKCLNSIVNQTYKNLEIIIINDGSTDGSLEICKKFKKNDNRIFIINQINEGLSSARNKGLSNSSGKYIIFIDSDDFIEYSMISTLYNNIKKQNYDVSVSGVMNIYKNKSTPQCLDTNIIFSPDKVYFIKEYLIGEKIPGTICNKLIKADIAKKLLFPIGKIYEDAFFHYDLIKTAESYIVSTKPLYNYYHRGNSITTKPFSKKDMSYIEIYNKFYNMVIKNFPELEEVAFFRLAYAHFFLLDKILLEKNFKKINEYNQIISFLKTNYVKIIKNKYFRKNRRIATAVLKINVKLYKILLNKEVKVNKRINK